MRLFKHPLSLRKTGETLFPTTEVSQGRVIPLQTGARVFPEAQPREWAAPANSSSEGLGNTLESSSRALSVFSIALGTTAHNRKRGYARASALGCQVKVLVSPIRHAHPTRL